MTEVRRHELARLVSRLRGRGLTGRPIARALEVSSHFVQRVLCTHDSARSACSAAVRDVEQGP